MHFSCCKSTSVNSNAITVMCQVAHEALAYMVGLSMMLLNTMAVSVNAPSLLLHEQSHLHS
eukprot:1811368-Amphidinium_carterae.1